MADTTITALPSASAVAATDVLPMDISAASATQKATAQQLVNTGLVSPGPIGGTTPAAVTGTNLTATGGLWAQTTWGGASFTDGVLIDYNDPEGRIAVGASDSLSVYVNGTSGTKVASFASTSAYIAGSVGVGTASTLQFKFNIGGTYPASAGAGVAINNQGTIDPTTASSAFYVNQASPAVAAGTLPDLRYYMGTQNTFTGTVTSQYGFHINSTLTGATNNYGFYSNIASGTNRWNFYAAGTASNYFAGAVGIGTTSLSARALDVGANITGATSAYGIVCNGAVQSDVTAAVQVIRSGPTVAAASFTLASLTHFYTTQGAIGSGAAVTNQYGFSVENTLTGATNNYGFYSNIASSANRYNFYAAGTAANAFAGDLTIYNGTAIPAGGTAGSGYKFSSTSNFGVFFGSGAPTLAAAKGSIYLRSDGSSTSTRMYVNTDGSTTWTSVTTAA